MAKQFKHALREMKRLHYITSLILPRRKHRDILRLYVFIQKAKGFNTEDYLDEEGFREFQEKTFESWDSEDVGDDVIDRFVETAEQKNISRGTVEVFFDSLERDFYKKKYSDMSELQEYLYGVAEIPALMTAKMLEIDGKYYSSFRLLGKTLQYTEFILDIHEQVKRGQQYVPESKLDGYGLESLEDGRGNKEKLRNFMNVDLEDYREKQSELMKNTDDLSYSVRALIKFYLKLYEKKLERVGENPSSVYSGETGLSRIQTVILFLNSLKP